MIDKKGWEARRQGSYEAGKLGGLKAKGIKAGKLGGRMRNIQLMRDC